MSNVITLPADPATNLLSSRTLGAELENLASSALLTQAHALVLLRQIDATGLPDENGLATVLLHMQGEMRLHANYYLDRLLPGIIRNVSDLGAVGSLMTAQRSTLLPLLENLDEDARSRVQAAKVAEGVADNIGEYVDDATAVSSILERESAAVQKASAQLEAAVQDTVEALDGPDGAIAKSEAEIAAVSGEIEADIEAVVKSSKDIGSGIKSLVTGVLTMIGLGEEKKKEGAKDDAASRKKTSAASGDSEKKEFPVESIDTVADGVGAVTEAMEKFRKDNAKLASLYQQMAQLNGLLSIARAVENQVQMYATSLQQTVEAAAALERTMAALQAGVNKFADEIPNPDVPVTTLVACLNTANPGWSRLDDSLQPIRLTLSGAGTLIPPRPAEVKAGTMTRKASSAR